MAKHIERYYQAVFANQQVERILEPGQYLSPALLLNNYGYRKFAESMPGVLTGLGIFGTFLGLVLGLHQIDIENLKPSIQQLVGGMDVAYVSSVVAIFFSLALTCFDKLFLDIFNGRIQELLDIISERLPIRNESDVLEEIAAQQREEIDTMRHFFSEVLIPQLVSGVKQAIEEHLAPKVVEMGQTVDRVAQYATSRQAEGIEQLVDKISNIFDITLERQFRELSESMNVITEQQARAAEQLHDLLGYFDTQTKEQATLIEQTTDLLQQLRGCLVDLKDAHTYLSENVEHINTIHERLIDLQNKANEWLSTITAEQKELVEFREKHTEIIDDQIYRLEEFWESTSREIAALQETLEQSVEGFKDNIHTGLSKTFAIFDDNLASISQTLAATIDELNTTVESLPQSFRALQATLQDFDSQSREVISRVEQHEETVNSKLDNLEEIVSSKLDNVEEAVNNKLDGLEKMPMN